MLNVTAINTIKLNGLKATIEPKIVSPPVEIGASIV